MLNAQNEQEDVDITESIKAENIRQLSKPITGWLCKHGRLPHRPRE